MPETYPIVAQPAPSKTAYSAGDCFTFSYPFIRGVFMEMSEEGTAKSATWRPGVRFEDVGHGEYCNTETYADGIGSQTVTVVACFRPGKFPERVFFTRKWRDPSGKVFGKGKLYITTKAAFTSLIRGYRHAFELAPVAAVSIDHPPFDSPVLA
jgi:hypothetical protein